jgi:Flp pilus assembly protein TadD
VLVLGTLFLYSPVRHFGFVIYDDPEYVTQNRVVQAGLTWSGIQWAFAGWHASNWHPLTWLSHMLDCECFGLDPGPQHLVSVVFHAANAGLLAFLLFRLTSCLWAGALVAALFAWHPLRVESVAWISERKDVLSMFFFLLTLLAYTKLFQGRPSASEAKPAKQDRGRNEARTESSGFRMSTLRICRFKELWPALVFFALGLMSKPMLVTVPFVLLLLDYWPLERAGIVFNRNSRSVWLRLACEKWPFFLLTLLSCIVTFLSQREESMASLESTPLGLRLTNAVVSYARYLLMMFWPSNLAVLYPLPQRWPWPEICASVVLFGALSWLALRYRRQRPHLLVGWLWYVGTLVPVIGLVQVGGQAMADRYTYLPGIGIALALVFEARIWSNRVQLSRLTSSLAAGVILAACASATAYQLPFWRESQSLFAHALAVTRDNAVAHTDLGIALEQAGHLEEALSQYETALRLSPNSPELLNNLGNVLSQLGHQEGALVYYAEGLRLKPRPIAHLNLGAAQARLGRFNEAMQHFTKAAQMDPADPRPHFWRGQALLWQGSSAAAVAEYQNALTLDPNDTQSLLQLACVLAADPDPAVRSGQQALAVALRADALTGGGDPVVLDKLAMAYAECARFAEASEVEQKAVERAGTTGKTNCIDAMQERLRTYQSGKPYREVFRHR